MIKALFRWIFKDQFKAIEQLTTTLEQEIKANRSKSSELEQQVKHQLTQLHRILGTTDISVDYSVNVYNKNWAVISIQGERSDFIRFIDLDRKDIEEINRYLKHFDIKNRKIDAAPYIVDHIKSNRY